MNDKPEWAKRFAFHLAAEHAARESKYASLKIRCEAEDSGGARCTADRIPEHEHRHLESDLP